MNYKLSQDIFFHSRINGRIISLEIFQPSHAGKFYKRLTGSAHISKIPIKIDMDTFGRIIMTTTAGEAIDKYLLRFLSSKENAYLESVVINTAQYRLQNFLS